MGQTRRAEKGRDGTPNGSRTRVLALRGPCPRPLDDGGKPAALYHALRHKQISFLTKINDPQPGRHLDKRELPDTIYSAYRGKWLRQGFQVQYKNALIHEFGRFGIFYWEGSWQTKPVAPRDRTGSAETGHLQPLRYLRFLLEFPSIPGNQRVHGQGGREPDFRIHSRPGSLDAFQSDSRTAEKSRRGRGRRTVGRLPLLLHVRPLRSFPPPGKTE